MVAHLPDEEQRRLAAVPDDDPDDGGFAAVQAIVDATSEPEPGDVDERIELVRTGLIRVWIGGQRYRLRRPFHGEFKKIRLGQETMIEAIRDEQLAANTRAKRIMIDASDELKPEALTPEDRLAIEMRYRGQSREEASRFRDAIDEIRLRWWVDVFTVLSLDGSPTEWPSWIDDANVPTLFVEHWRSVPLGRG